MKFSREIKWTIDEKMEKIGVGISTLYISDYWIHFLVQQPLEISSVFCTNSHIIYDYSQFYTSFLGSASHLLFLDSHPYKDLHQHKGCCSQHSLAPHSTLKEFFWRSFISWSSFCIPTWLRIFMMWCVLVTACSASVGMTLIALLYFRVMINYLGWYFFF